MNKNYFLTLILPSILLGSCAHHEVQRGGDSLVDKRGASYYLPKTAFDVQVVVKKIEKKRPKFYEFCQLFFGVRPSSETNSLSFTIDPTSIAVTEVGVRDPDQKFVSIFKKSPFATSNLTVNRNEDGILTTGNATVTDNTIDFTLKALQAATSLRLTSLNRGASIKQSDGTQLLFYKEDKIIIKSLVKELNTNFMENHTTKLTVEGLRYGLYELFSAGTEITEDQFLKEFKSKEKLTAEDSLSKADWDKATKASSTLYHHVRLAVEKFKEIQVLKDQFGKMNRNSDSAKYLKESIDGIYHQFVATSVDTTPQTRVFRWIPQNRANGKPNPPGKSPQTILKVNTAKGVVSTYSNAPVNLPFDNFYDSENAFKDSKNQYLYITARSVTPSEYKTWEVTSDQNKKKGWHYRIPAKSTITVTLNNKVVVRKKTYIAQHGCVAFLPSSSGSVSVTSNITLNPITGGLMSLSQNGTAASPDLVTGFAGVLNDNIKDRYARQAKKDQEAANNASEVYQLEQRKKLLQLQKDVRDLEKNLGITN